MREFIQLPLEEKLKYEVQERDGYGQAFIASDNQKLDWVDRMYLTILPPENRQMKFWPEKPVDFRETLDQYATEIQKLCNTVLRLLSENIGLKSDYFINMHGEISLSIRCNYYPPCHRPDLVFGLSPHSDGGSLTVLLQDDEITGLQICKDGEWIPVQPLPGALVINIGDMLEVMSNGKYESIEHQAVTNMHKDRISVAMFYAPGKNTEVGPAPELIDELHPCHYRRFIVGDYLQHFLSNKFDRKKKIEFAKIMS